MEMWGSPLLSGCPCLSKAKLLDLDFSFFLSHTYVLSPFPAPITPLSLCLSELEGEVGGGSEEGKKGFSFSVSLFPAHPHCQDCCSEQPLAVCTSSFPLHWLAGM